MVITENTKFSWDSFRDRRWICSVDLLATTSFNFLSSSNTTLMNPLSFLIIVTILRRRVRWLPSQKRPIQMRSRTEALRSKARHVLNVIVNWFFKKDIKEKRFESFHNLFFAPNSYTRLSFTTFYYWGNTNLLKRTFKSFYIRLSR